jgi:hypothetical protein
MNRTIKAIECHMISPVRLGPQSTVASPVADSRWMCRSSTGNCSMPLGHGERRNIVFHEQDVRSDDIGIINLTRWKQ